jgi:hypothetical protein
MTDPKPLIRHVDGGVVSADAYPDHGEPDWKQECARLEELVFQRTCERDALRVQKDSAFAERNQCVALIARMAPWMGWNAGVARHPDSDASWERDWMTIVFVDLPTGQASWHFHDSEQRLVSGLPRYLKPWDGHSTEEKYRRVDAALTAPCILADHECESCGRIQQPCPRCQPSLTPWGGYAKCRTCDGVMTTDEFSKGSHCESCQQVVG